MDPVFQLDPRVEFARLVGTYRRRQHLSVAVDRVRVAVQAHKLVTSRTVEHNHGLAAVLPQLPRVDFDCLLLVFIAFAGLYADPELLEHQVKRVVRCDLGDFPFVE